MNDGGAVSAALGSADAGLHKGMGASDCEF